MKKWVLYGGIVLVVIILFFIFKGPAVPDVSSKISDVNKFCKFNSTEMPIVMFLPRDQRYRVVGDNFCFYTLTYKGTKQQKALISIEKGLIFSNELEIREQGAIYLQEGFYIHLISTLPSGIRIAITRDGKYNVSDYYDYLQKCFQNPECKLLCEDLNGVYIGEGATCPRASFPLSDTDLVNFFVEDKKECCLNYMEKPILFLSKSSYYRPEYLKAYYFGTSYKESCTFSLETPSGRFKGVRDKSCYSFRRVSSFKLLENIGEEYGSWNAQLEVEGEVLKTPFIYEKVPLQTVRFNIDRNGTINVDFNGLNYEIGHESGCGEEVNLQIKVNGFVSNLHAFQGGSYPIGDGVNLIVYSADCKQSKLIIMMMKDASPVCPNNYCELEETPYSCPWDCKNATYHDNEIKSSDTVCSSGCYYNSHCLAQESVINILGVTYECLNKELRMVE